MSHLPLIPVTVLVLGNDSLLDECVSSMLIPNSQLNVIRIQYTDEKTLDYLVNLEDPSMVFINEFDALNVERIIRLIFSARSAFVRCVIVAHSEHCMLDLYYRPTTHVPVTLYRKKSILVNTKEELINLTLEVASYA